VKEVNAGARYKAFIVEEITKVFDTSSLIADVLPEVGNGNVEANGRISSADADERASSSLDRLHSAQAAKERDEGGSFVSSLFSSFVNVFSQGQSGKMIDKIFKMVLIVLVVLLLANSFLLLRVSENVS